MAKILIVEDDPRLQKTYEFVFLQQGHTIVVAADGEEGLRKLGEEKPDLVLLDMMMPMMSGVEFLQQANIKTNYPSTKVVVFSNLQDNAAMELVLSLGASRYEIKSTFTPKQMSELVQQLLTNPQN